MTKEEMIEVVKSIKQPVKQKKLIFKVAKELGLNLKQTSCGRCLKDYIAILKEELGMVKNAAEESAFNSVPEDAEYRFIRKTGTRWKGRLYNQNTPAYLVREFVKHFPVGFYEKIEKKDNAHEDEQTINNEE